MYYATLTQVRAYLKLDTAETGDDALLTDFIRSSSRYCDTRSGTHFYPLIETRYFDVPENRRMLQFDDHLLELTGATNGDSMAITLSDLLYHPATTYPKYGTSLKAQSSQVWTSDGYGECEQVIALTGVWGYHDDYSRAWVLSGDAVADALGLDASLTPTPAEPRNTAQPIKSVSPSLLEIPEAAQENRDESTATAIEQPVKTNLGDQAMDNEVLDSVKALTAKVEALETTIKNAPPVKTLGNGVEVIDNEKPFKSIGDQLMAIKAQAEGKLTERQHNGIKAITADYIKATGASEAVASDGGVLLQPDFSNDLTKQTFEYGTLLGLLNVQEIGPNANSKIVNRVKETSIASTLFGGVTAYWTGEAGAYSATKPTFTQDEVKLNKVTGLYYATDELMQDATALSGEIMRMFSSAIRFKVESAVWEGNGVGMPLGITAGGSVVTQAKEGAQAADSVVYENVIKMYSRLFPASQRANTTAWFVNNDVLPQLNTLVQVGGTAAIPAKFVDWGLTASCA
ncbi:MAG: phage major capsid protein [Xanthomonadales bacterium]|nr:phage major capsid protein [Xanthomonadales bacterium]